MEKENEFKLIDGGVCAPEGFSASGVHCGIRKNAAKKDLALIYCSVPCRAAGVYTRNLVVGAPVTVTREHLKNCRAQAIICNSGNANTCNSDGIEVANAFCSLTAEALGIKEDDVIVASTGVIGQKLSVDPVAAAMGDLVANLGDCSADAAEAIMPTDTVKKSVAIEFELGGKICHMGGIAKGVGMVCPNMATNLIFLTTDVNITANHLQWALSDDVRTSFNMVSVDGDQSTNDTCCIMASGLAGNKEVSKGLSEDFKKFRRALNFCTTTLAKMIAKDGEGATKLVECHVHSADSRHIARTIAKSVVKSNLVKAAMFGADANWGRVLCAMGYSGAHFDPRKVDVRFISRAGNVLVCKGGYGVDFSEELAKEVLSCDEVTIDICLNGSHFEASAWGCDLTYEYVKINGDYRT